MYFLLFKYLHEIMDCINYSLSSLIIYLSNLWVKLKLIIISWKEFILKAYMASLVHQLLLKLLSERNVHNHSSLNRDSLVSGNKKSVDSSILDLVFYSSITSGTESLSVFLFSHPFSVWWHFSSCMLPPAIKKNKKCCYSSKSQANILGIKAKGRQHQIYFSLSTEAFFL